MTVVEGSIVRASIREFDRIPCIPWSQPLSTRWERSMIAALLSGALNALGKRMHIKM
jgi:hypothetical protein